MAKRAPALRIDGEAGALALVDGARLAPFLAPGLPQRWHEGRVEGRDFAFGEGFHVRYMRRGALARLYADSGSADCLGSWRHSLFGKPRFDIHESITASKEHTSELQSLR